MRKTRSFTETEFQIVKHAPWTTRECRQLLSLMKRTKSCGIPTLDMDSWIALSRLVKAAQELLDYDHFIMVAELEEIEREEGIQCPPPLPEEKVAIQPVTPTVAPADMLDIPDDSPGPYDGVLTAEEIRIVGQAIEAPIWRPTVSQYVVLERLIPAEPRPSRYAAQEARKLQEARASRYWLETLGAD
jgi:hypothetical protein